MSLVFILISAFSGNTNTSQPVNESVYNLALQNKTMSSCEDKLYWNEFMCYTEEMEISSYKVCLPMNRIFGTECETMWDQTDCGQ